MAPSGRGGRQPPPALFFMKEVKGVKEVKEGLQVLFH